LLRSPSCFRDTTELQLIEAKPNGRVLKRIASSPVSDVDSVVVDSDTYQPLMVSFTYLKWAGNGFDWFQFVLVPCAWRVCYGALKRGNDYLYDAWCCVCLWLCPGLALKGLLGTKPTSLTRNPCM
jgi:hypothetical protein